MTHPRMPVAESREISNKANVEEFGGRAEVTGKEVLKRGNKVK